MKHITIILVFGVGCILSLVRGMIDPGDLPDGLKKCFEMKTNNSNVKEVPSEDICITCITDYLWKQGKHVHCFNKTEHDVKWVAELLAELHPASMRTKRSAPRRCRRKEYRMLTDDEREDYHRAVNLMKKDKSIWPNRYDGFVIFHSGMSGKSAHRGPNFYGWHRILLIMYEYSLRKLVPGVCLPYWDSTLDSAMSTMPENSIIWSKHFMGNGDGQVQTGPFRRWMNIDGSPLMRNIGSTGQLLTKRTVLNILSKRYNHQICEPSQNVMHSLEGLHDQVHMWIGGKMFDIATSPMDPIFFMHHAFVDCLWEIFRKQQIGYKIDPSKDYPNTGDLLQHPDRPMDSLPPIPGFGRLRNKDGYLSYWTDKFYFYDPPPTCSFPTLDCGSKWLECDTRRKICVSKSNQAMSFQYPTFNSFNPWNFYLKRGKRDTYKVLLGKLGETESPDQSQMSYEKVKLNVPKEVALGSPIQNAFDIDCVQDIRAWAFMAIKVIHLRPQEVKMSAHIIENGKIQDTDMYNESNYRSLKTHIRPGSPAMYDTCMEDNSGAFRINLVSRGLSYNGWYEDYVMVDNRLPISSHVGYIAFKKPGPNDTEPVTSFISATDTCGRMCKPKCLKKGSGSKPTYVPCDGVIKATAQSPLMYGETYGDAAGDIWDFSDPMVPVSKESGIFMIFYCDYSDTWPWESCNKK
ncbi:tyrosinase-like protein 2 [Mytilus edulis]